MIGMKTILTLSLIAFAVLTPDMGGRPKTLAEPASVISSPGTVSYVFQTEGNVPSNTSYTVTCSAPGYFFNLPSTIVVPSGSNTANLNVTYNGGNPGNVTFTVSKDGESVSSTVYYGIIQASKARRNATR
jgi:hypothetical protein